MSCQIEYAQDPAAIRGILNGLPAWFGDPQAIENYVADSVNDEFVCVLARDSGTTVGAALLRRHYPESAELHLIAISPEVRGQGIGRELVARIVEDLQQDGCVNLTVHTVGPSFASDAYAQTRAFYLAAGFLPLEEHWNLDWPGPTLILVRRLSSHP